MMAEYHMFNLCDILSRLHIDHRSLGSDFAFARVAPLSEATSETLAFVNKPHERTMDDIRNSPARVFLIDRQWGEAHLEELDSVSASVALVERPRLVIAQILRTMHPSEDAASGGVHPTASVHPDARIDPSVSIGPHSIVGRVTVGAGTRIGPFCTIHDDVGIGCRVTVREHCLVGGTGFGFARDVDGRLQRLPHVGRVVIEDDVELFPYVNVDRSTLSETRIRKGTKVDHYAHIGHNSVVGRDCVVTARAVLCGSVRVGDRVWVGVGAVIKEGVAVGSDVTIGIGAVVLNDVPDGQTVAGVPARRLRRDEG